MSTARKIFAVGVVSVLQYEWDGGCVVVFEGNVDIETEYVVEADVAAEIGRYAVVPVVFGVVRLEHVVRIAFGLILYCVVDHHVRQETLKMPRFGGSEMTTTLLERFLVIRAGG